MKLRITTILLVGSFLLFGCTTTLKSTKVEATSTHTTSGLTYRLPAKQFTLSTAYQVTGCSNVNDEIKLEADVNASLSERMVGAEAYTLDYSELDEWTKITDTEFRLSEAGLLTGVNAGIADQTGVVIQNTVVSAAGIARAVAIPATFQLPTAMIANLQSKIKTNQLSEANVQLQSMQKQFGMSSKLSKSKSLSEHELNIELANLITQAKQSSCDDVNALVKIYETAEATLKTEQANDKKRDALKRKKGEAEAEISRLSELKDVYKALGKKEAQDGLMTRIQEQEKLQAETTSELNKIPTSGTEKAAAALASATIPLTINVTEDLLPKIDKGSHDVSVTENDIPSVLRKSFKIKMPELPKVTINWNALTPVAGSDESANSTPIGIAYRIPVAAMARVTCECGQGTRTLIEHSTQIPQFGPIGSLDLKNGPFANNILEVVFNAATGAPEKLTFHSKSRAEAASASARDATNSYVQLQKDKRDDIISANKATMDQQTALLTLEKNRNDVSLAGTQAAAAAALYPVTTEKSLVAAQIDLLRDQQRLDAIRTGTASAAEVQLEALANQQKLLEQKLKIMQLEKQIAEQKALQGSFP